MRTSLFVLCTGFSLLVTACSGRSLDVGDGDDPSSPNGSSTDPGATPGGDTTPAPDDGSTDTPAQCTTVTANTFAGAKTPKGLTELLARRWSRCTLDIGTTSLYGRGDGIEFTADGHFYLLREGAAGFDRLTGADESGTWLLRGPNNQVLAFDDTTPGDYSVIEMHHSGTFFGDKMEFATDLIGLRVTEVQVDPTKKFFVPIP